MPPNTFMQNACVVLLQSLAPGAFFFPGFLPGWPAGMHCGEVGPQTMRIVADSARTWLADIECSQQSHLQASAELETGKPDGLPGGTRLILITLGRPL